MIGEFFLLIFATIIFVIVAPISSVFSLLPKRGWAKRTKNYFAHISLSLDQHLNVIGRDLFSWLFIVDNNKFPFGKVDETISSVIGKNKQINNLTKIGTLLDGILGKEHSLKAIEEDE